MSAFAGGKDIPIIDLLASPDRKTREAAGIALLCAFDGSDPSLRKRALGLLDHYWDQSDEAVPQALLEYLCRWAETCPADFRDDDAVAMWASELLRKVAVVCANGLGDLGVYERYAERLASESPEVRRIFVDGFSGRTEYLTTWLPRLIPLVDDPDLTVRRAAFRSLARKARVARELLAPIFERGANDADEEIREAASEGVEALK